MKTILQSFKILIDCFKELICLPVLVLYFFCAKIKYFYEKRIFIICKHLTSY